MNLFLAASSIFRASALHASGVPWLADGVHLRVQLNPWIGFPIHPFAAWRLPVNQEFRDVPITWTDPAGKSLPVPFDLEAIGGEAHGAILGTYAENPCIWLELDVDDRGLRVDLLDGKAFAEGAPRVVATRRHGPFRFGHTRITALRASGAGTIAGARGILVSDLFLDDFGPPVPDLTFGLPMSFGPWHAPDPSSDPRADAEARVLAAAPQRLSPPDNPTAALPDGSDPVKETRRIMDAIGPRFVDPWLDEGFGDPAIAPVHATRAETGLTDLGKPLATSAPVTPSLLTMAVDPQIARYLGLATLVPPGETGPIERVNVWLIASRWAVQPNRVVLRFDDLAETSIRLDAFLAAAATVPGTIIEQLGVAFPEASPLIAEIPDRAVQEQDGPWSIVTLLTVAVAAGDAPPDPPEPFALAAARPGAWNPQEDPLDPGPESWQQSISLGDQPVRGMVGFARMSPGTPVALHRMEPPPNEGFLTRALPLVPNRTGNNRGLVTDRVIPSDPGGASWQVWQADEFGQWSDRALLSQPLPARPAPPPPVVEATYLPEADDGSTGSRIPGSLRLRYEVPDVAYMAPGSLPITELRITVDGLALPAIAVTAGETVVREVSPAPFSVGEHRQVPIVSIYANQDGNPSTPETTSCAAFDARAPRFIPTSPVLIWTGQPDVTGQAELSLRWPPREGAARYRVYLGDARRLAGELGLVLPDGAVRSAQADPIHAASENLTDKQSFTFLGEVSGIPSADGHISFSTQIPGLLRSVQFVRVVPMTAGGAEAAFSTCGLVPVAVPGIDRPPPPILEQATSPTAGLTLTIRALGLRADLLATTPGGIPEYRLRRTRGDAMNRMYVPIWKTGLLADDDGDGVWSATITIPAAELDPFVRTTWLAEVRYPPEPPIPPGVVPLPVDGGVEPVWSLIGSTAESIWSDPSLAAESLLIPTTGPSAPPAPTLTTEVDASVTLTVGGLPVAHPAAIAPFRMEIYRGTSGAVSEKVLDEPLLAAELTWNDPAPVPAGTHYDLVVVDPIGRRSPPTRA